MNERELADRLQTGLAKPLTAALRTAVERQLLPPMEAAMREAFRQACPCLTPCPTAPTVVPSPATALCSTVVNLLIVQGKQWCDRC